MHAQERESLRISPDDFTLISRKDGERSPALSPTQIAGAGALVVKPAAKQPGGDGTRTNGPIWGGISIGGPRVGAGNGSANKPMATDAKIDDSIPENPILPLLKEKVLPDKETKDQRGRPALFLHGRQQAEAQGRVDALQGSRRPAGDGVQVGLPVGG